MATKQGRSQRSFHAVRNERIRAYPDGPGEWILVDAVGDEGIGRTTATDERGIKAQLADIAVRTYRWHRPEIEIMRKPYSYPYNSSRNAVDGRYKPGARVAVELRTRPIIGKVMEFGGRPVVEYSPTTRTRFTGTLIKQNGDKWDIKSDSGEIYKDVKEADFGLSYNTRSSNAVVQKAMNATARNADFKVGDVVGLKIMDGGRRDYVIYEVLPDSYRLCYADDFGVGCERVKKWPSDEFVDKHRRIKVPMNADTSVLHETAVNAARTTNAVVAKALNARRVARNAISGFLPNGMPAAQASAELGALADKLVREADNVAYGKHGRRGVSAMVDRRSGSISDMRVHVQFGSAYRELEGKVDSELKALGRKYGAKDAHVFFWKGDAELTLTF